MFMFMFQYHMCSLNTSWANIYPGYISIPISIWLITNKCCYWRILFVSFVACSVVRLMNSVHVCVYLLLCFHMVLLMLCLYRVYITNILRIYSFLYWENTTSFALWWLWFSVSFYFFFPFITWILSLSMFQLVLLLQYLSLQPAIDLVQTIFRWCYSRASHCHMYV